MTRALEMMGTSPSSAGSENALVAACIDACLACAQACTSCADACLAESDVDELRRCIALNVDCADLCGVTARVLSRRVEADQEHVARLVELCADACRRCGDECQMHASMHEHCRVCAEACRTCEEACRELVDRLETDDAGVQR